MYDLRAVPPTAGPLSEQRFDEEPVRWDQRLHHRRVRGALLVTLVLAVATSLGVCVATDEGGQNHHPPRAGPTVRDRAERSAPLFPSSGLGQR
jgi:hypothetical protein